MINLRNRYFVMAAAGIGLVYARWYLSSKYFTYWKDFIGSWIPDIIVAALVLLLAIRLGPDKPKRATLAMTGWLFGSLAWVLGMLLIVGSAFDR